MLPFKATLPTRASVRLASVRLALFILVEFNFALVSLAPARRRRLGWPVEIGVSQVGTWTY